MFQGRIHVGSEWLEVDAVSKFKIQQQTPTQLQVQGVRAFDGWALCDCVTVNGLGLEFAPNSRLNGCRWEAGVCAARWRCLG